MDKNKHTNYLEKASLKLTDWIGTPYSIVLHTVFFAGIFLLNILGVTIDKILLVLTTAVSLEAIYLAIFIQMTVNQHSQSLTSVKDNIEDIQEDVEELSEDVEDITEDLDQIQDDEQSEQTPQTKLVLENIEKQLRTLQEEICNLKTFKSL